MMIIIQTYQLERKGYATDRLLCSAMSRNRESAATGEIRCGAFSCPSWARTRTLLIQRGRYNQPNSSNLQPFTRVVSPDAGV
jgi:hypothetical protein